MEENTVQTEKNIQPQFTVRLEKFEITKKDNFFVIAAVLVSVITSVFGICGGFRGGFSVSAILAITLFTIYLASKKVKIKIFSLVCVILGLGVSLSFAVTSNYAVRFFSTIVLFLLILIWCHSLVDGSKESGDLGILKMIFWPVFDSIFVYLPVNIGSLLSNNAKRGKKFGMVILGIVVAVPFLLIIIPLLMSSDEAFNGMARLLGENIVQSLFKIFLGLFIAMFVISYGFTLVKNKPKKFIESDFKGIESTILISFLSVISICYLAYLFSQMAYFFSAFSGFLPQNYSFTVSDYARRGFFEMSAIAAFNLLLIFVTIIMASKTNGKICVALRILCTFIGVFTLIIIATALSKMVLYIQSFGMTKLRINTSAFMIFLGVVFIGLMLRVFLPKIQVIKTALITAAILLAVLGIVNVNTVVAHYNYNAFKNGTLSEIDIKTIYDLGDEGVPYLVKLAEDEDYQVVERAEISLRKIIWQNYNIEYNDFDNTGTYYVTGKKYNGLGQKSFSRSRAYAILDKFIEDNPNILWRDFESFDESIYYQE